MEQEYNIYIRDKLIADGAGAFLHRLIKMAHIDLIGLLV